MSTVWDESEHVIAVWGESEHVIEEERASTRSAELNRARVQVRSMHVIGEADEVVVASRSLKASDCFGGGVTVLKHSKVRHGWVDRTMSC